MEFLTERSSSGVKLLSLLPLSSGDFFLKSNSLLVVGKIVLLCLELLSLHRLLLVKDVSGLSSSLLLQSPLFFLLSSDLCLDSFGVGLLFSKSLVSGIDFLSHS